VNLRFREKKEEEERKIAQGREREGLRIFRRLRRFLSFAMGVFAAKVIKAAAKYIFGFANSPFLSAGWNFFWLFEKWKLRPRSTRTSANELGENIPGIRFSLLKLPLCDRVTLKRDDLREYEKSYGHRRSIDLAENSARLFTRRYSTLLTMRSE